MGTTRDYRRYDGNTTDPGFQDCKTNTPNTPTSTSCLGQCTTMRDKSDIRYTRDKCPDRDHGTIGDTASTSDWDTRVTV